MDKFTEKTNEFLKLLDEQTLIYTAKGAASEDAEDVADPLDKQGALTSKDEENIRKTKLAQRAARGAANKPTKAELDAKQKIDMLAQKLGNAAAKAASSIKV